MPAALDLADVQGNILRSYGTSYRYVRHLILQVAEPGEARAALRDMTTGDRSTPEVTTAAIKPRDHKLTWCLNVGITYRGLEALGLPGSSLCSFPPEFRQGMVARAARLGDVGSSAPATWIGRLGDPGRIHLVVTLHGQDLPDMQQVAAAVLGARGGQAFVHTHTLDGEMLPGDKGHVHFGYRDGLANVRFDAILQPGEKIKPGPVAPLGAVLLGHPTPLAGIRWRVPQPDTLGHNGAFNAFRVLRQDVRGFEAFLHRAASETGSSAEEVAAKVCGRWRNGVPLVLAPTHEEAKQLEHLAESDFGYGDDLAGARCPLGSHVRRSNPRDSQIVQRGTSTSRLVVRRGYPYGPPYPPEDEASADVPRGLLGSFLCASLAAQFEALQADWLNLGLQDPRITGMNDPMAGANEPTTGRFGWRTSDGRDVVVHGLPRFVHTDGGAYCFLPSLPALRWIATESWPEARRQRWRPWSSRRAVPRSGLARGPLRC